MRPSERGSLAPSIYRHGIRAKDHGHLAKNTSHKIHVPRPERRKWNVLLLISSEKGLAEAPRDYQEKQGMKQEDSTSLLVSLSPRHWLVLQRWNPTDKKFPNFIVSCVGLVSSPEIVLRSRSNKGLMEKGHRVYTCTWPATQMQTETDTMEKNCVYVNRYISKKVLMKKEENKIWEYLHCKLGLYHRFLVYWKYKSQVFF